MPDVTVQTGAARRASHVKGYACRGGLRRIVPVDHAGIGDGRSDDKRGVDLYPKAHNGAVPRLQITVLSGVVRRKYRGRIVHPGC